MTHFRLSQNNSGQRRGSHQRNQRRFMLESLERRELLSVSIGPGGSTATYTDVDGDIVRVTVSKGRLTPSNFITTAAGLGDQLQEIDLTTGKFNGASVIVRVRKSPAGDGHVNIGYINATGNDLRRVVVPGDLGRVDAGDARTNTAGLALLSADSLGAQGLDTQGGTGDLTSNINGALGTLRITHDLDSASVEVGGGSSGRIGHIVVGGSLVGGDVDESGQIHSTGGMGSVEIAGDIQGGAGMDSGSIVASGKIASITVDGSIIGGDGSGSAEIGTYSTLGRLWIGGDFSGGNGIGSGEIVGHSSIASIFIGGSVIGTTDNSAQLLCNAVGSLTVQGSFEGGAGLASGTFYINGPAKTVTVGGGLVGGAGVKSAELYLGGGAEKSVSIDGDIQGGTGDRSGYLVIGEQSPHVSIGGSLLGNNGSGSGMILLQGEGIATLYIQGNVVGGSGSYSGSVALVAVDTIGPITVRGTWTRGSGDQSGQLNAPDPSLV